MKNGYERKSWAILSEQKRAKSEDALSSQVRYPLVKSKSEGGSDVALITNSCVNTPHKVLSRRTVDLVLLMKKKEESPANRSINRNLHSSPELRPDAQPSTEASLFIDVESGEDKNSRPLPRTNSGGSSGKRSNASSSYFISKYIAAPSSTMEDITLACESRDSEEESRIAVLKQKTLNDAKTISSKSLDSFRYDSNQEQSVLKIFLIGDEEVGKTSLLRRHCENRFVEEYLRTCGVDFKPDVFRHSDGSMFKCQLWDTGAASSPESFHVLTRAYFKSVHAFAIVFSLANRDSFSNIDHWFQSVKSFGQADASILLVGNKSDSLEREVSEIEAKGAAEKFNVPYIETSAASGLNVTTMLEMLMSAAASRVIIASSASRDFVSNGNSFSEKENGKRKEKENEKDKGLEVAIEEEEGQGSPISPSSPFSELDSEEGNSFPESSCSTPSQYLKEGYYNEYYEEDHDHEHGEEYEDDEVDFDDDDDDDNERRDFEFGDRRERSLINTDEVKERESLSPRNSTKSEQLNSNTSANKPQNAIKKNSFSRCSPGCSIS